MFKWINKRSAPKVDWQGINNGDRNSLVAEAPTSKKKTTNELIDEIHETFFIEVDRLLAEANITVDTSTDMQGLIEKSKLLESLGFVNTKEVEEAKKEQERLSLLHEENEKKAELISAIKYFSVKYPNYKFITEASVKKICEKYNLVYGTVDRYKGIVPDENLEHILKFKVDKDDECYAIDSRLNNNIYYDWREAEKIRREEKQRQESDFYSHSWFLFSDITTIPTKCKLEIAAPMSDFDMTGYEVKDKKVQKIEVPDPVVLHPVIFNRHKYYLIVTAWGKEASDELVVNQKMN